MSDSTSGSGLGVRPPLAQRNNLNLTREFWQHRSIPQINLLNLSKTEQLLLPWLPPHAQKGRPCHRLSVFVLQQKDTVPVNLEVAAKHVKHNNFILRSSMDRHLLKPIGVYLIRNKSGEGTVTVLRRAAIEGADVESKRIKVEPLPYKRRNPLSFR